MKKIISILTILLISTISYSQIPMSVGVSWEDGKPSIKQKRFKPKSYIVITDYEPTMEILDSILKKESYMLIDGSRWYIIPNKKRKKVDKALSNIERSV